MEIKTESTYIERLLKTLTVGLVPAALEISLISLADPTTSNWVVLQSALAWFSFGVVIHLLNKESRSWLKSVAICVLLCMPWYIAESYAKNTPEHLLPMIVASLVMGSIIGWLSIRLHGKKAEQASD